MITAVDTNVLLDVFKADSEYGQRSGDQLRRCMAEGALVACEVVWAELAVMFPNQHELDEAMNTLNIAFLPMTREAAHIAGLHWKQYIERGGSRSRLITDFLIAGHAQVQCDQLLTRDYGFYKDHYRELTVISPNS